MIESTLSYLENRRSFRSVTAGGLAVSMLNQATAAASTDLAKTAPAPAPGGKLGAAGAGPGRLKIAMLIHPRMIMQDFVGPLTVFNLMRCEIHLVWKNLDPIMTEVGLPIVPTTLFRDCPRDLDVLFSPGGLEGTIDAMNDAEVLDFFADVGRTARYITSDCTGSLVLGAAGLLRGYRATSHWSVRDEPLRLLGAIPVHERVVVDRNRITGGGVTAGIDFGLTLAGILRSREEAEGIQLLIEYAPAPPFSAGTPETAPRSVYVRVAGSRAPVIERARQAAAQIGASFRP